MEARDVLNIIYEKNRQNPKWKNRRLYRLLCNPTLHIMAYERLKSKSGNMTPGIDGETLDGYSLEVIEKTIDRLRQETYQPKPVRRTYIAKEKGKRPLGIPSPHDKIVQECLRLILEAIYEPQFHDNSHGFRSHRSCHTALESMRRNWVGTKWAIKADISACFEQIDHHRLLDILREKIEDDRFINLVRRFLTAGYLEKWEYHKTHSGTPQGSVVSPILANIYLDKLDQKLATLCHEYSQGKYRRRNSAHIGLMQKRKRLLEQGETNPERRQELAGAIKQLNQQIVTTPAAKFNDPSYVRVKFLRYADDVTIGVIGPKALAEQIVEKLASFLQKELNLTLNRNKTRIYHLPTEPIPFLGYLAKTATPRFRRRNMQTKGSPHNVAQTVRTTTGNIKLLVPLRQIKRQLKRYMAKGRPTHMSGLLNWSVDQIIEYHNGVIRGWYNYYQLAENVGKLNYARYVLRYSLAKTLAAKERTTLRKIFHKYGQPITFRKPNGKVVQFFNRPMKQVKRAKHNTDKINQRPYAWPRKTKSRLTDHCSVCGHHGKIEMHHVRHIRKRGQHLKGFKLYMAAINRKQIPVCHSCHRDIHNGKYDGPNLSSILEQMDRTKVNNAGVST